MADLTPVKSSNIAAVGYNAGSRIMTVQFNSGQTHDYSDVPPHIHQGLMGADSAGGFFHRNVRDAFSSRRVDEDE